jgi:hypothetical protein
MSDSRNKRKTRAKSFRIAAASRKKGPAAKQGQKLIDSVNSNSSGSPGQARACLIETPLAMFVRRRTAVQ